jgi:isopentenyl-diphosphate delta-isomerase
MGKVVLVDEQNQEMGTADKDGIHTQSTPLHRGFSLFLFNSKNELLLTQRALNKQTFPGIWTNTVCGHPGPGESNVEAARRRLKEELGIKELVKIEEVAPYKYKFTDQNGIVENENCPILVGYADLKPHPNPQEVADWKWIKWEEFLQEIKENPQKYSPWSVEEARILEKTKCLFEFF